MGGGRDGCGAGAVSSQMRSGAVTGRRLRLRVWRRFAGGALRQRTSLVSGADEDEREGAYLQGGSRGRVFRAYQRAGAGVWEGVRREEAWCG